MPFLKLGGGSHGWYGINPPTAAAAGLEQRLRPAILFNAPPPTTTTQ